MGRDRVRVRVCGRGLGLGYVVEGGRGGGEWVWDREGIELEGGRGGREWCPGVRLGIGLCAGWG